MQSGSIRMHLWVLMIVKLLKIRCVYRVLQVMLHARRRTPTRRHNWIKCSKGATLSVKDCSCVEDKLRWERFLRNVSCRKLKFVGVKDSLRNIKESFRIHWSIPVDSGSVVSTGSADSWGCYRSCWFLVPLGASASSWCLWLLWFPRSLGFPRFPRFPWFPRFPSSPLDPWFPWLPWLHWFYYGCCWFFRFYGFHGFDGFCRFCGSYRFDRFAGLHQFCWFCRLRWFSVSSRFPIFFTIDMGGVLRTTCSHLGESDSSCYCIKTNAIKQCST